MYLQTLFPFPDIGQITSQKVQPKGLIVQSASILLGFLVITGGISFVIEWAAYRNYGKTKPTQYDTCGESVISCTSNDCSFGSKDNYPPEIRCVYRIWMNTDEGNSLNYSISFSTHQSYSLKIYSLQGLLYESSIDDQKTISFSGTFLIVDFRSENWSADDKWKMEMRTGQNSSTLSSLILNSMILPFNQIPVPDGIFYTFKSPSDGNLFVALSPSDAQYGENIEFCNDRQSLSPYCNKASTQNTDSLQLGCMFDTNPGRIEVTNSNSEESASTSSFLYLLGNQQNTITRVIQARDGRQVEASACSGNNNPSGGCNGGCCDGSCANCCLKQPLIIVVTILVPGQRITLTDLKLSGKDNNDTLSIICGGTNEMNYPKQYVYTDKLISDLPKEISISGSFAVTIQALDAELISFQIKMP